MNNDRILSMVALCKRAGKLISGFDAAVDAIAAGKSEGVFLSSDLSEKSKKSISYICGEYQITPQILPVTMDELAFYIRRRVGILVVTDKGLAGKISTLAGISDDKEDLIE